MTDTQHEIAQERRRVIRFLLKKHESYSEAAQLTAKAFLTAAAEEIARGYHDDVTGLPAMLEEIPDV